MTDSMQTDYNKNIASHMMMPMTMMMNMIVANIYTLHQQTQFKDRANTRADVRTKNVEYLNKSLLQRLSVVCSVVHGCEIIRHESVLEPLALGRNCSANCFQCAVN